MARYIDADKLLEKAEEIEWFNESTGFYDHINIVHKYDVEVAPTADVVPMSEFDKTVSELAWLHADTLNKLDNAKADVAREIFEEIEKLMNINRCYGDSGIYYEYDLENDLSELKKKYTEELK